MKRYCHSGPLSILPEPDCLFRICRSVLEVYRWLWCRLIRTEGRERNGRKLNRTSFATERKTDTSISLRLSFVPRIDKIQNRRQKCDLIFQQVSMDEHLITRGQAKTNHFQRRCPAERCMLQGLGISDNTDIFEYDQELGARIRHFT